MMRLLCTLKLGNSLLIYKVYIVVVLSEIHVWDLIKLKYISYKFKIKYFKAEYAPWYTSRDGPERVKDKEWLGEF